MKFCQKKKEKKFDPGTLFEAWPSNPKTVTLPIELPQPRDFGKKKSVTHFATSFQKVEKKKIHFEKYAIMHIYVHINFGHF